MFIVEKYMNEYFKFDIMLFLKINWIVKFFINNDYRYVFFYNSLLSNSFDIVYKCIDMVFV